MVGIVVDNFNGKSASGIYTLVIGNSFTLTTSGEGTYSNVNVDFEELSKALNV